MYPKLFDVGPITIYTYGALLAAAYLVGVQLALVRARRWRLDPTRTMDLAIWVLISALVGAKLMLLAVNVRYYWNEPAELLTLLRSGGVFYGGLILAVVVALWYLRRHQMPLWLTCDAFAPGIALGHVIGRLGCVMAGCCFGRPTDLPWGITFTHPLAAANVGTPLGVPLHPTQLYEAGAELLIFALLLAMERRGRQYPGRTFWSYLLLYAVSRFVIEFYRGDERGLVFGVLSTSQFVSLMLAPLSLVMLGRLGRRPTPSPARGRRAA